MSILIYDVVTGALTWGSLVVAAVLALVVSVVGRGVARWVDRIDRRERD